jgi:uncharacterized membrane protein YeaQ/YmgE (transglycosylase-associated protein family)
MGAERGFQRADRRCERRDVRLEAKSVLTATFGAIVVLAVWKWIRN